MRLDDPARRDRHGVPRLWHDTPEGRVSAGPVPMFLVDVHPTSGVHVGAWLLLGPNEARHRSMYCIEGKDFDAFCSKFREDPEATLAETFGWSFNPNLKRQEGGGTPTSVPPVDTASLLARLMGKGA